MPQPLTLEPTPHEERQRRGTRAQELLNDPLIKDSFEALEAQYITLWKNSDPADSEGRDRIYNCMQSLNEFQGQLSHTMQSGKMSQDQTQRMIKRKR